ncbi:hypothetical protein GCM10027592_07370 [Spirosoma flavus]
MTVFLRTWLTSPDLFMAQREHIYTRWALIFLFLIGLSSRAGAQCFQPTITYPSLGGPVSVATGDFNGDGKVDLVTASLNNNNVSVRLGDGLGNFGAPTTFTASSNPLWVAVGDFNNDGKADLVTANVTSNNVSVLLGTGTGSFGPQTTFSMGGDPSLVVVGDFNSDGQADIAVANSSTGSVTVRLGTGTGSFGALTTYPMGNGPSLAIADFNGDGKIDLVTANGGNNNVAVRLGDGSGGFGAQTNFAAGSSPSSVAVGDVNGDGKVDLVVANYTTNNVSVLLGTGAGGFGSPVSYAVGNNPRSVAVGDINGDGKADLAVANYNSNNVSVLLGNGTGSFSPQATFTVGNTPRSVVMGDFNGDGKVDLVSANETNNSISVRLNCADVLTLVTSATPNPVAAGTTTALSVTASGGTVPYSYTWAAPAGITLSATSTSAVSASVGTGVSGPQTITITAASSGGSPTSTSLVSLTVNPCNSVVYVTPGGAGLQDGSSWTNAFSGTALQTAINTAAGCGAQVWVAAGTYKPTTTTGPDSRTISFSMRNGVAIYGGFQGNEATLDARPSLNPVTGNPSSTTLSGDIGTLGNTADNSYHVINNPTSLSLNNSAILDGFVITGGNANDPSGQNGIGNNLNLGGGIFNNGRGNGHDCSPLIRNCSFEGNSAASKGGAIYNNGFAGQSSPVLVNCFFQNNSAPDGGGAICNDGFQGLSSPTLTNCLFQKNSSTDQGGAILNSGYEGNSNPILTNCTFLSNSAAAGGAIGNDGRTSTGHSNPTLINCLFQNNSAINAGGAIFNNAYTSGISSPTLTNCAFLSNSAKDGGAMFNDGVSGGNSNPVLTNCSFQNNAASSGGGGAIYNKANSASDHSLPTLVNCVVFGNGFFSFYNLNSIPVPASYSLFDNTSGVDVTGPGNLTTVTSPFASTSSMALAPCSPAINAGLNSASGLTGITTDLAGNPRFYNSGTGTPDRVDMGAYEFQGAASTVSGITAQPIAETTVCVGSTVTASVSVSGTGPLTYQWYKDGSVVNAQTSATLSLTNVQTSDAGSYSAVVTGSCNSLTSTAFSLTVNATPTATLTPRSATLTCASPSVTLTAGSGSSYTLTGGAGTQTNTNGQFVVSVAGTYTVTVANANGCTSSTTATVVNAISATLLTWTGAVSTDWNTAGNWCPSRVPLTSDDVLIPSAPANKPVLSTTAVANSVEVGSGSSLSITTAGSLTINGSRNNNGFINRGTVTNNGLLVIGNESIVTGSGLANRGTFQNTAGGIIQIDRTTGDGVSNQTGTFTNSATITVGASATLGGAGIGTQTTFLNNPGGLIQIDRTTNGITNLASTFTNSATITVGYSASVSASGIGNQATFRNNAGGLIQIGRTGSHGINSILGTFTNAAIITMGASATVGASGINNQGIFQNNAGGLIQIDRTGGQGITTGTANGAFTNAAILKIGSLTTVAGNGIQVSGGTFTNSPGGNININRSNQGINVPAGGSFINSSTLTVGDVAFSSQDNIFNRGTFTNTVTGEIRVDRAYGNGIWNVTGTFRNDGKIFVGSLASTGQSGIYNTGISFANSAGGSIQLDRVGLGLKNVTTLTNAGQIRMGNNVPLGSGGILNGDGSGNVAAVFTNLSGGLIQVDQTATNQNGLTNEVMTTFTNAGTVTIGTLGAIGGHGITNAGTVSNSACGALTVFDNINNGDTFVNAGLFTVKTSQPHSNTGTLTNNGIIDYPQGNPIPNVVNNDVIAAPISSCGSPTITPALQLGSNNNQFTVGTTWYSDQALTQPAGSYDQGSNTFTATALSIGSSATLYFAATDNANSCTKTVSISVTLNEASTPSITANPSLTICQGTSVTLTASGGTTYLWNNGTTTAINIIDTNAPSGNPGPGGGYSGPAGPQSVTVTNAVGCSSTATVYLTITPLPVAVINPPTLTVCQGQPASLTASGGSSYLWSTGETTAVINVTATGTYSVTVSGATGPTGPTVPARLAAEATCSATASATLTINELPNPGLISSGTITCAQTSVTLTASGGTSYTFLNGSGTVIGTPGASNSVVVSSGGTYSVIVANASGCTANTTTTVAADQTPPTVSITPSSATLTCTNPTASLTAVGTGTYRWTTGATTSVISATSAGTYSVTLTGANGCTATTSAQVFENTSPPVVNINPTSATLTCTNPAVSLTAVGNGSLRWNTGATSPVINATSANTYSVTLTSANGCTATASVIVSADQAPPSVSIIPSSATLTCTTTSVSLSAVGAGTYRWTTGATTSVISATSADTYSVTLTGTNGCTATTSAQVFQDVTPPTVSITPSSATLTCTNPTVSLTAVGTGTYRWNDNLTSSVRSVTAAGTYSVTVTGTNGCTASTSVVVGADQIVPTVSISPSSATLTCTDTAVSLTAVGTGTYRWSNGATTSVISASLANTYSVTLTGTNGCTATTSAQVFQNTTPPSVSITPSSATLTCTNPTVSLTAVGTGTYRWSTGATSQVISATSAATYSVTLTGTNGCTAVASAQVVQDNSLPVVSITANPSLTISAGQTTTLTASGAATYQWNTGATTSAIVVNTTGVYSVTGTNGICSSAASVTVSSPFAISSVISNSCQQIASNRYVISFTPRYTGLNGQPVSFSIANEIFPTTDPGPYTLQLYTDNPTLILHAQQAGTPGEVTYTYNWLAVCQNPQPNTPPRVDQPLTNQTARVGQGFGYTIPQNTFTDNETPQSLTLTVNGLPAGLSFTAPAQIGGVPTTAGTSSVTVTATDPGGLTVSATFVLTVIDPSAANTSPIVANSVPDQLAIQGQSFTLSVSNTFSDAQTPQALTLAASGLPAGLTLVGTAISGTPSQTGTSTITLKATDPGGLTATTSFSLTVQPSSTIPFAITGVSPLTCTQIAANRYDISFTPRYSGVNGQTITFEVVSELAPTTAPGPYSLQLYNDKPSIILKAKQAGSAGEASFTYNWLSFCQNPQPNTPPRVNQPLTDQVAKVGQAFGYTIPQLTFTDNESPQSLSLSVSGLPAGLSFSPPTQFGGVPSATGISSVTVTATDPQGLTVSTSFTLRVVDPNNCRDANGAITSVKAGSWDDPAVWSCGVVPGPTDVVQLNHVVSLPASYVAQIKTLRYGTGGKLTYQIGARLRLGF